MGRRRKVETLADFQRSLNHKYGLGNGSNYKPWLRVQDFGSHGNSGKIFGIKSGREHHTFSEHESCFFYLAEFCDSVTDIREQFPLLPLDLSIKIAKTLKVDHPVNPESSDPNVLTTDFILTRSDGVHTWYEAVSVKPANQLVDRRTAEKLDLERVWWRLLEVPFYLFVMTEQNIIQSRNIQWFTSPYRQGRRFSSVIMDQAVALMCLGSVIVEELCNDFVQHLMLEHDDALALLKVLLATKTIEVDLSKPIAGAGVIEITHISKLGVERQNAG